MKIFHSAIRAAKACSVVFCLCALDSFAGIDPCKPVGWATRVGRTDTPFEVTGGGNVLADTVRCFSEIQSLVGGTIRTRWWNCFWIAFRSSKISA
ncbi:MAG: hypothetical protein HUK20_10740 [Fibrobacter sp.]|nr:hypothetical protein [Fibrobacter sp.]